VGVYQRLKGWIPLLHEALGTRRHRVATDIRRAGDANDHAGLFEALDPGYGRDPVHSVTVKENGGSTPSPYPTRGGGGGGGAYSHDCSGV
jgi:hypothetical protein